MKFSERLTAAARFPQKTVPFSRQRKLPKKTIVRQSYGYRKPLVRPLLLLRLMYDHLRERNLYTVTVKTELHLAVQKPSGAEDIRLVDLGKDS